MKYFIMFIIKYLHIQVYLEIFLLFIIACITILIFFITLIIIYGNKMYLYIGVC